MILIGAVSSMKNKRGQFIINNRAPGTPEPYAERPKYYTYYEGDKVKRYRVEGREKVEIKEEKK